jgi:histone-lysine N-methyltransferase SETD2
MEHKPMMVDDLPVAWDEAHATFTALDKCVYETKGLGLSREQDDMMVCDCVYDKRESNQLDRAASFQSQSGMGAAME